MLTKVSGESVIPIRYPSGKLFAGNIILIR